MPLERSKGPAEGNAILSLFAQHPVCFPHRTMTSGEPVLSNLTEGYCAALIPPDYLEACQAVRFSLRSLLLLFLIDMKQSSQ